MKKRNLFLLPLLLLFAIPSAQADSLESVRVLRVHPRTQDLIIQRDSGEKLLIQHNRSCSSMNTEFPVQLLWDGDEVTKLKVAFNEICTVYNFGPYSSDVTIEKRVLSGNQLTVEDTAQIKWKGSLYEIEYETGCRTLREYVGERAYVHTPEGGLEGGMLYLPKSRGQCSIASSTLLEEGEDTETVDDSPIKNFRIKAENNQAIFSWDAIPREEKWLPIFTYSKFEFDPSEYDLRELPGFRRSRGSILRVRGLVNDQTYHFYRAAINGEGQITPWTHYEVTSVQTIRRFRNQPDPEVFEIELEETDDAYILTWPDKAEKSKRYMIQAHIDGKRVVFKTIIPDEPRFEIPKNSDWEGERYKFSVRTIPLTPFGPRSYDGIFWTAE